MKKALLHAVLFTAIAASVGALSDSLVAQIRREFQTRNFAELVNRDLISSVSPSGREYFQGRADGYAVAAMLEYRPHTWAYVRGFSEAFAQSAALVLQAEELGHIEPVLKP